MTKTVSLCITSFNRFNLLKQTLGSFLKLNTYPIEKIFIIEDSTNPQMKTSILNTYGNTVELIYNDQNIGQAKSIDKMYSQVQTDYIFHSEEDYFYDGNANFIEQSIDILEERKDVHQIWCRDINNFDITHHSAALDQFESDTLTTISGTEYRMVKSPYNGWCGFSWNPGLRRLSDYKNMFPNGYAVHVEPGLEHSGVHTECNCNKHAMSQGYRAAILINGACINMGVCCGTYK